MNAWALVILGVAVGHPAIERFDSPELEALDAYFDDCAYTRGWRPWGWIPGTCIHCCATISSSECGHCGWLQE